MTALRRSAVWACVLALYGCGGGGSDGPTVTPPTPTIGLVATPQALTVVQGQSGTVQLAVTRSAGFSQPVTVSASGLPTGVTAAVSPSPLTGATSTATVDVVASASAAPGTYPITVSASAAGVTGVSAVFQLTIAAAPSFAMSLAPAALSINAGSTGSATVTLARTNLAGAIALSLVAPPTGISATFTPPSVTANTAALELAVASTVAPGAYTLTVQGSSAGASERTATLSLTVNATPNFTLATSNTPLPIIAGTTGVRTITLMRTNFTGDVALTLAAPPAGITASFAPATTSGTTSDVTIAVSAFVAAGNYTLQIAGTSSEIGTRTTTVPIVVSLPTPVLTQLSPDEGTAGDTVDITLTGTGFVAGGTSVAVSGAGVTVSNVRAAPAAQHSGSPLAEQGSVTSLIATLAIAADATPGARTVTVTTPGGTSASRPFTILAPPPAGIAHVAAGHDYTCAIRASGETYCFGYSFAGTLGNGTVGPSVTPVLVSGGHAFAQLAPGGAHNCGLTVAGAAFCWGRGLNGTLGNGSTADQLTPVPVSGGHVFRQISTGLSHSCGVRTDGRAFCWGLGNGGRLGNGATTNSAVPVEVAGGHTFLSVNAGPSGPQSCGVRTDGVAMCWGQLIGNQPQAASLVPVAIGGGHTFSQVVFAQSAVCGITTGGIVRCWGDGFSGRLGNGSTAGSSLPMPVIGGHSYLDIAGSSNGHFCGVTTTGDARCWGPNTNGKLGDGTTVDRNVPTLVLGGHRFVEISVGGQHSCARTVDNRAFCWGWGNSGRLGTGTTADSFALVEVTAAPLGGTPF